MKDINLKEVGRFDDEKVKVRSRIGRKENLRSNKTKYGCID